MKKKVFTTGEVAKLLGININTVIKWFDDGEIGGFRLPGNSGRRIPMSNLMRFMGQHGIPFDLLEEDTPMRRRHVRVGCGWKARLSIVNGHEYGPYEANFIDVSNGGARLSVSGDTALSIPVGKHFITLGLEDGPLAGTVVHGRLAHLNGADSRLSIGLEFTDLAQEDLTRLNRYVETAI